MYLCIGLSSPLIFLGCGNYCRRTQDYTRMEHHWSAGTAQTAHRVSFQLTKLMPACNFHYCMARNWWIIHYSWQIGGLRANVDISTAALFFHSRTGGPFLITDMRREDSIFDIDPSARERFRKGIEKDGSNLTVVSCVCYWKEYDLPPTEGWDQLPHWQLPVQDHTIATDTAPVQIMSGSHVIMNQEAGSLLSLALRYVHGSCTRHMYVAHQAQVWYLD